MDAKDNTCNIHASTGYLIFPRAEQKQIETLSTWTDIYTTHTKLHINTSSHDLHWQEIPNIYTIHTNIATI